MASVALVGRLLLSLAVVLGLMWLIARRMRRSGGRAKNGKLIEVLSRQQLTKASSVAVIRILDQALIVGVSDGQVAVLGQSDLDAVQEVLDAEPARPARPVRTTARVAGRTAPAPPARTSGAARRQAALAGLETDPRSGRLSGSALSLSTWRQSVDALRDLTVRRT
jgi:flagellar protein FliO/FliZ